jgi:hypothetical protein
MFQEGVPQHLQDFRVVSGERGPDVERAMLNDTE